MKAKNQLIKPNAKNAPNDQKNAKPPPKTAVSKKAQVSEKAASKKMAKNKGDSDEDQPAQKEDVNGNQVGRKGNEALFHFYFVF